MTFHLSWDIKLMSVDAYSKQKELHKQSLEDIRVYGKVMVTAPVELERAYLVGMSRRWGWRNIWGQIVKTQCKLRSLNFTLKAAENLLRFLCRRVTCWEQWGFYFVCFIDILDYNIDIISVQLVSQSEHNRVTSTPVKKHRLGQRVYWCSTLVDTAKQFSNSHSHQQSVNLRLLYTSLPSFFFSFSPLSRCMVVSCCSVFWTVWQWRETEGRVFS